MRDIISFLATQGWEKVVEEEVSMEFIDRLVDQFSVPLEDAQADISKIRDEFYSVLQYAIQFISLSTLDYTAVCWRLLNVPSSSEWGKQFCFFHCQHTASIKWKIRACFFFTPECDQITQENIFEERYSG